MPTREEVLATARLAGLTFTPAEIDRMRVELRGILEHASALRQLAPAGGLVTPGTLPIEAHPSESTPLRPDLPGADPLFIPPSAIAPAWCDGFFTLPRAPAADESG